jgi:hypothetical protein
MKLMKKICALLLVGSALLAAPKASRAEVKNLGIKAGMSITNVFGGSIFEQKFRTGFCGGLFLTYGITSVFSIQPEVLFVMKGSKHGGGIGPASYTETLSLEYAEIPVLARFRLPLAKSFGVYLFTGPAPAFSIRQRVYTKLQSGDTEEEALDNVKGFDLGFVAGAGFEFPVNGGTVILDLRYTFGLTSISRGAGDEIRNGAACLMVGFEF